MERLKHALKLGACFVLAAFVVGTSAQQLSAQVTIPQGSTINLAVFSIYALEQTDQTVYLRRVGADWGECSVTYNSIAPDIQELWGSFTVNSIGWHSVTITGFVQAWVNGIYPNYGFILMQDVNTPIVTYRSSEYASIPELRPKLEITFTTPAGLVQNVVIQSTEIEPNAVIDTAIRDFVNLCTTPALYTGQLNGIDKFSLLRFNFRVPPPSAGTGTPGYWMNHPQAWPVPGIDIGGIYYPKAEAINLMFRGPAGDMTYVMFAALVAAKLNVLIGNDASCISSTIAAADAWMNMYPVGSGVGAGGRTSPWRTGEPLYKILDDYNNGLLCAPSRDTIY